MTNIDKALEKINMIEKRSRTLPWSQAGNILLKSIDDNFQLGGRYKQEGSFEGGSRKWVKTKKRKNKILVKDGDLKNRIKKIVAVDGVEIKSSLAYSAAQQYGYKKRNLPARPFIVHQKKDIKTIGTVFKNHMIGI